MIELRKISNKKNETIYWSKDKFEELKNLYPEVTMTPIGTIMINRGKNKVQWLDLFKKEITFRPFQSFCRYLYSEYGYTAEEFASQVMFGDRNLIPYDADTKKPCNYHNLTTGYRKHSDWSSHNKETQRARGKDKVEHNKMRICFAYNRALGIAKDCDCMYLYIATLKNEDSLKFGVTKYKDLDRRKKFGYGDFDGSNYKDMRIIAYGDPKTICMIERDFKMQTLNVLERIKQEEVQNLIEFARTYSGKINVNANN